MEETPHGVVPLSFQVCVLQQGPQQILRSQVSLVPVLPHVLLLSLTPDYI